MVFKDFDEVEEIEFTHVLSQKLYIRSNKHLSMQILFPIALILAALLAISLLLWRFWFLRNPTPKIPEGKNIILSPANGNIAKILPFRNGKAAVVEKGFLGKIPLITNDVAKEGYILLIRLHVYNIHWQRAPIAGTIEKITYTKGKFLNAVKDVEKMHCLFENEKNEILIKGKICCKVIQIAGFLARRIECFVKERQNIVAGDIIGLINLGSQTALIVPKIKLKVKEGDIVQVGETVIGEINQTEKIRRGNKNPS